MPLAKSAGVARSLLVSSIILVSHAGFLAGQLLGLANDCPDALTNVAIDCPSAHTSYTSFSIDLYLSISTHTDGLVAAAFGTLSKSACGASCGERAP